jgi:hypothetical protein
MGNNSWQTQPSPVQTLVRQVDMTSWPFHDDLFLNMPSIDEDCSYGQSISGNFTSSVWGYHSGLRTPSREFSEAAYRLAGQPKELVLVAGAGHVDLSPFDKLTAFYRANLK